jgi:hypothetical protein
MAGACAVHCLIAPLIAGLLPVVGAIALDARTEWMLLSGSLITSVATLVTGCLRTHGSRAALVPLAAGLVFGISPLALQAGILSGFVGSAQPTPSGDLHALRSVNLGFTYLSPSDWNATDYSLAQTSQPFVVVSRLDADRLTAATLGGELTTAKPSGVVMTLGRPPLDVSAVDTSDPLAVLAFQVSELVATPPAGVTYEVVRPVHALNVGGKPGAQVVIKVIANGVTTYYERAYVATGSQPLFRIEAGAPASDWEGGDGARVDSVLKSLSFSR